jgi:hypothetical protein
VADEPRTSLLWKRPENVARAEEVRGFGGVVGTLIAGFCLAAIAQLVSADDPPPLYCIAVAALTAASMLFSVQFSFLMLRHSASPEERLAWYPEARVHPTPLATEREQQAEDKLLSDQFYDRARFFFNLGLIMFFTGLGFTVVPDDWNAAWIAAVATAAIGGLVEAWWAIRGGGLVVPKRPLMPTRDSVATRVDVSDLDEVSKAALSGQRSWIDPEAPPRTGPAPWRPTESGR